MIRRTKHDPRLIKAHMLHKRRNFYRSVFCVDYRNYRRDKELGHRLIGWWRDMNGYLDTTVYLPDNKLSTLLRIIKKWECSVDIKGIEEMDFSFHGALLPKFNITSWRDDCRLCRV